MQPYSQPTATPTAKMTAVALSGLILTVLSILADVFKITLPPSLTDNVPQLIAGVVALTSIVHFLVGYLKKDKKPAAAIPIITAIK